MQAHENSFSYHPDVKLFLLVIPFISAFNYYLTYPLIRFNSFLLLTFSIDTIQGYLAWWAVRAIILKLDVKLPYTASLWKRIVIQLLLTSIAGMGIIIFSTEVVSWIARGKPAVISFYTIDIFIIYIWFLVINGIYIGIYFYRLWQQAEATRVLRLPLSDGIPVKSGNLNLLAKFDDMAYCYVEGEYVKLVMISGKSYFLDQSLNKLEEKLPLNAFFRLNRQCILHRQVIAGFRRIENGKLDVQLVKTSEFQFELTISRTKAVAFKRWFLPQ